MGVNKELPMWICDTAGLHADGTISHSLMVAALYRFQLWNAAR